LEQTDSTKDLEQEILNYLDHQIDKTSVTRFLLKDYILEQRALLCGDEEIEHAIGKVEEITGLTFPEGSLSESIKSRSADELKEELLLINRLPEPAK
jgi:hypothetical protein